jgi:hypothetical protein
VVSATALTPSDLAAERIRETTAQVLAGPDFADARPGVLDQAARWALDRVGELLAAIIAGGGGPLGLALLAVALVALGLIVASLVRRVRRDRGRPVPRPDGIGGRSAADWAAALRCRYRALLADLVAAGVLDEVPGRTARGYQRDVASAAPAATRPMREVTRAFEAAWYDRRPVDAADVAALRDAADAVRRRVPVAA